jgi:carboxymethylenebutenolidase
MKIKTGFHQLTTPEGTMEVYFVTEDGRDQRPVMIVCQEAFGVNHHIKDVCQRFAREGYYVVAPEFYHRKGKHLEFAYSDLNGVMPLLKNLDGKEVVDDLNLLMTFLKADHKIKYDHVSMIGFCVGGYITVLASTVFKLKAAVAFYGGGLWKERKDFQLKPLKDEFDKIKNPLLLIFGDQDSSIPLEEIQNIEKKIAQVNVPAQVKIFQDVGHGFFCNERSSYEPSAAEEAWKLTLEFLKQNA